ncbi:MAG: VOC family protein [Pseudomonadota bacterium]
MKTQSIDHVVLTVRDITATYEFYEKTLGMQVITFSAGRTALQFGTQKINLHLYGKEFEPKASHPAPGSADLCFITDSSPKEIAEHLESSHIDILDGPVQRTGARGPITSYYFRDPDGNLIELATYA